MKDLMIIAKRKYRMGKRFLLCLMVASFPIILSAQIAGGQVKRLTKKQQTTTTKKTEKSSSRRTSSQKTMPITSSNNSIIQKLINNMVYVEGGSFMMGATAEQGIDATESEKPPHKVNLSSFSMGKYEVTQEEWQAVMGNNPSGFKGTKLPIESVSWNEAQEFIRKLNDITGKKFRMPTEAEWEYAARGGNRSKGYKYSGSDALSDVAWHSKNGGYMTHEIGRKKPNELGLYDMAGNVWEWCQDLYGSYSSDSKTNPTGSSSGSTRVARGGSWISNERYCRLSYRNYEPENKKSAEIGLRLAL